jgi:hypothetical protein
VNCLNTFLFRTDVCLSMNKHQVVIHARYLQTVSYRGTADGQYIISHIFIGFLHGFSLECIGACGIIVV